MKIAIFEFDYHFVQLVTFCKMFEDSKHTVTVFTTTKMYKRFAEIKTNMTCTFVVKEKESAARFMQTNHDNINNHDLVFFNTVASEYRAICNFNFTIPTIVRIHNANTYLKPFQNLHLPKNLFELFKYASFVMREMIPTLDFYYISKLIKKIDCITLNDYYREEYVIKNKMIENEKIFPCLPFAMTESLPIANDPDQDGLIITIPGAIDERKRDYLIVVSAIKQAVSKTKKPIVLYLLGKSIGKYGSVVISKLKELESENFELITFENFIPQEDFDRIMGDSDLILAPLIVKHQFRIYTEVYGESKSSGSLSDLITYGKLTIFPTSFFNDEEMNNYIDYYDSSNSLAEVIVKYGNDRDFLHRRASELRSFLMINYSPKVLLNNFEEHCRDKFGIS